LGASEVARLARVQRAALSVLFAGILAVPAVLGSGGGPLHLGIAKPAPDVSPPTPTTAAPQPTVAPGPKVQEPLAEHPITPPSADDLGSAPTVVLDDAAPPSPAAVAVPAPTSSSSVPNLAGGNVYALVIGINDYPGSAVDLQNAVADADDMVTALVNYDVPTSNIVELVDGDATAGNIVRGMTWLVSTAPPGSTAVFYYSGHARKLDPVTEAIVGSDGIALTDRYLARRLLPLESRDAWIVISACYGGGFDEMLAPGRILTAAADANSLAYESDTYGRSYLGEFLVRRALIEGRAGGPTVQQAYNWAQASLQRVAPDRTLTEYDASSGPISLDGVRRSSVPPAGPLDPPDDGSPPGPVPPATVPPPPPSPLCKGLFGVLCSSN